MHLKLLLISISFLFTCPIFSQNIFIDSNQVAIFLNGGSLWSSTSHTFSISGGLSLGGILDFSVQHSSISVEGQGYYDTDEEYNVNTFLISGILTKKKMQITIDFSITSGKAAVLFLGFGLAKKIQVESTVEAVISFSTGLGFDLDEFPGRQEFALGLSVDLLMMEVFYFGPGVGYSGEEFFYGLNAGIVVPFTSIKDSQ